MLAGKPPTECADETCDFGADFSAAFVFAVVGVDELVGAAKPRVVAETLAELAALDDGFLATFGGGGLELDFCDGRVAVELLELSEDERASLRGFETLFLIFLAASFAFTTPLNATDLSDAFDDELDGVRPPWRSDDDFW